jgi:hypothetical protein
VLDVPGQRQALHTNQQVGEALDVFESEIRQQRLVHVFCVIPDPTAYNGARQWHGMVILPNRGVAKEGDTISIQARPNGPLNDKVFEFKAHLEELPGQAFHTYTVTASKTIFRDLKCDIDAEGLPQHVTLHRPIPVFELEYSQAERARHRQFTDQDFAEGRVGIGSCALRDTFGEVYYQPSWLFRVPNGTTVRKGDVVEIKLGEAESGAGVGTVSLMTRNLGRRPDFPSDGHAAIFCN